MNKINNEAQTPRGGMYAGLPVEVVDHQESYLKTVFRFLGITDVRFVRAEGLSMGDRQKQAPSPPRRLTFAIRRGRPLRASRRAQLQPELGSSLRASRPRHRVVMRLYKSLDPAELETHESQHHLAECGNPTGHR